MGRAFLPAEGGFAASRGATKSPSTGGTARATWQLADWHVLFCLTSIVNESLVYDNAGAEPTLLLETRTGTVITLLRKPPGNALRGGLAISCL